MVLGVAGLTGLILQKLKQPSILGYLVAGLIVGPYIPVPLFADPDRVNSLSEFGVILVMFTVGLDCRLKKFVSVLPVSGVTARAWRGHRHSAAERECRGYRDRHGGQSITDRRNRSGANW